MAAIVLKKGEKGFSEFLRELKVVIDANVEDPALLKELFFGH